MKSWFIKSRTFDRWIVEGSHHVDARAVPQPLVLVHEEVLLDPEGDTDCPEQVVGEALGRRSVVT